MNKTTIAQQAKTTSLLPPALGLLQRKCACGNHTVAAGECTACAKNKSGLQRKLTIGASNDPLEQEADRVADQVLAAPPNPAISSSSSPHIQRYAGQANEGAHTAPVSVERVFAGSGRPLEPALRQDMGQRFGYDFSQVRVHSGVAAEQSAREMNANAYTSGRNIVFGTGRFEPGTPEGRRLIAHELTHVLQQSGSDEIRADQSNKKRALPPVTSLSVQKQDEGPPTATSETTASTFPFTKGSNVAMRKLFPDSLFGFAPNNISNWVKGIQDQELTVTEATPDRVQLATVYGPPAKPRDLPGSTAGAAIPNVSIEIDRIGSGRFQIKITSGTKLLTSQEVLGTRGPTGAIVLSPVAAKSRPLPSASNSLSAADEYAKSGSAPVLGIEGPSRGDEQKALLDALTQPPKTKEELDVLKQPGKTKEELDEAEKTKVPTKPGEAALPNPAETQPVLDKKVTDALGKVVGELYKVYSKTAEGQQWEESASKQIDKLPLAVLIGVPVSVLTAALVGLAATKTESPVTDSPDIPIRPESKSLVTESPDIPISLPKLLLYILGKETDRDKRKTIRDFNELLKFFSGLKVNAKVTYNGPANKPTEASITITFGKGSLEVAPALKATWLDPAKPPSLDNKTGVEASVSVKVPLGADPPKKTEPTSAEKNRAENLRIGDQDAAFRGGMKYPPGSPEAKKAEMEMKAVEPVGPKPIVASQPTGDARPSKILQSFDVQTGPGKLPWNLDRLVKQIGDAFISAPGATLLVVATHFDVVPGDTGEGRRTNSEHDAALNAATVKGALEKWLPMTKGRIQTSIQVKGTGRTFGLTPDAAAQLGTREVAVIFLPGSKP